MFLNDDIADIHKPDGNYSLAFVVMGFVNDEFYILQSFLINTQDLHKYKMIIY